MIHGLQRLLMAAVRLAHCLGDYLGDWMVRKLSDLLQEIKDYLYSIRHNAANAALARSAKEYEVCIKTVFDCEEAVLSLFRKLDREFGQLQAKAERYKKVLREIANEQEVGEGDFNADDVANNLIATAKDALEGEE